MTIAFNTEMLSKTAASIKLAAFVDELVKEAAVTGDPIYLGEVVDLLTPAHEELLKQAGLGQWLGAAKAGLQNAGSAIAGAGQKAIGAMRNMGAAGAQARMLAAGAEHDAAKRMMAGSGFRAPAAGAPVHAGSGLPAPFATSAAGGAPLKTFDRGVGFNVGGRQVYSGMKAPTPYNAQNVSNWATASDLARTRAAANADMPMPVPAGQVRYNPMEVSGWRANQAAPQAAPTAIPAMRQAPQRAAAPGMIPALQPAMAY